FAVLGAGVRNSPGQTPGAKEAAPPTPPAPAGQQPATSPSPPPSGETAAGAAAGFEEDERLAQRLLAVNGDVEARTSLCLDLAWNPEETDGLRAAALRRLRASNPRILADLFVSRIGTVPVPERVGMLGLMGEVYRSLGGVNNIVNSTLADQIRCSDTSVAAKAISVCSM